MSVSEDPERKTLVHRALLAEECERYEDMAKAVVKIAAMGSGLVPSERNLLSIAFKNLIGSRRQALRVLLHIREAKIEGSAHQQYKDMSLDTLEELLATIKEELKTIALDCVTALTTHLCKAAHEIPSAEFVSKCQAGKCGQEGEDTYIATLVGPNKSKHVIEEQMFYLKMMGDYYRYLAEAFKTDEFKQAASQSYEKAMAVASHLPDANPVRLGLALNFSVYHYEIMANTESAQTMAQAAFTGGMGGLTDLIDDAKNRDATLILQLLRDNLLLWQTHVNDDDRQVSVNGTAID